jgi:hypothetical protein
MLTMCLTGCEVIDRSLTDMGIVKNEEGKYKAIDQGELEEYNRLVQEAREKGIDPADYEKYAKEHGWTY